MMYQIKEEFRGASAGLLACVLWGALVLFWSLFYTAALELLAYRIICSLIFITPLIYYLKCWPEVFTALSCPRTALILLFSGLLVGLNWFVYIWAIMGGMVLETSLGYYISPLLSILLGCIVLKERPTRLQFIAIGLVIFGVLWSLVVNGRVPWISLVLGFSFSTYALIHKQINVEAVPSMLVETLFLTPLAVGYILWLQSQGQGFWQNPQVGEGALLLISGAVTSYPLALYAYAARHLQFMSLGIMQYIPPSMAFLLGIFYFKESFNFNSLGTFIAIWLAIIIYTAESIRLYKNVQKNLKIN